VALDPVEQQGRAFGPPSRDLRDAADLVVGIRPGNVPQRSQPLNCRDEVAQVSIGHVISPVDNVLVSPTVIDGLSKIKSGQAAKSGQGT